MRQSSEALSEDQEGSQRIPGVDGEYKRRYQEKAERWSGAVEFEPRNGMVQGTMIVFKSVSLLFTAKF